MFAVTPIPAFNDNYIWALTTQDKAIIVDPGDAAPVLHFLAENNLALSAILLTHHHADHCGGIPDLLVHNNNCPVFGPSKEAQDYVTQIVTEDSLLGFPEFDLNLSVFDLPGHTLGHIGFYNEQLLFCGDTLFSAGCGRLFEGTPEQLFNSLHKLKQLGDSCKVYCAHEYTSANLAFAATVAPNNSAIRAYRTECEQKQLTLPSTMGLEKNINPFLMTSDKEVSASANQFLGKQASSEIEVLAALRQWKDTF